MKILICGTRGIVSDEDFDNLWRAIDNEYSESFSYEFKFIHGDCPNSPDQFAKRLADDLFCEEIAFPADWKKHGKKAGIVRNWEMIADRPDFVFAVWDGVSKGTLNMIHIATQVGIPVRIIPALNAEGESH